MNSVMNKVRWGILSTAKIAREKVIPAMRDTSCSTVVAIASRDLVKAGIAAREHGIPRSYGSYEELIADSEIDAIYIPLPNHLHAPWATRALEAGKHVLCEKPIALSASEAEDLLAVSREHPHLKIMEAFMYRHHPQWVRARELVETGQIGVLRTIHSFFSYYNADPNNIRNMADIGGGGLMDIGCYCISLSRMLFAAEPRRVCSFIDHDPGMKTDRLSSAILDFGNGTATFTCSTQLAPYQRVHIFGEEGRIEIEIPFNAPPDQPCRMWHTRGDHCETIVLDVCDQYRVQGDLFSQAILEDSEVPSPLDDAVMNMRVIESIKQTASS